MFTDDNYTYDEYLVMYIIIKLLSHIPETIIILYIHQISIKTKKIIRFKHRNITDHVYCNYHKDIEQEIILATGKATPYSLTLSKMYFMY